MKWTPRDYREHFRQHPIWTTFVFGILFCFLASRLWVSFSIALFEQHTSGIVTGLASHGQILYRYTVGSQEYSGRSIGEDGHFYPKDSPVEVRYSGVFPSFSTLTWPLLFPGQLLCAVVIFGGIFLLVRYTRRRDVQDT